MRKLERSNLVVGQMVYGVTDEEVTINGIVLLKLEVKPEVETEQTAVWERFVVKSEYEINGTSTDIIHSKKEV